MSDTSMNVYQRLLTARALFHASPMKKSGWNGHAKYAYFELADIVPVALQALNQTGLVQVTETTRDLAVMTVYNVDEPTQSVRFTVPWGESQLKGTQEVQNVGSSTAYLRRYLYMLLMDIIENDAVDAAPLDHTPAQDKQDPEQDPFSRLDACTTLTELQSVFAELFVAARKAGLDEHAKKLTAHYDGLKVGLAG